MDIEIGECGAEELIASCVALCHEMGIGTYQMKLAVLALIAAAIADDEMCH